MFRAISAGVVSHDFPTMTEPLGKVTVISSRGFAIEKARSEDERNINNIRCEPHTSNFSVVFGLELLKKLDSMGNEFRRRLKL